MIIAKDITVKHNELCQISQCCLYRACLCKLLSTVGPTLCTYLYSQATFRHVTVVATTSSREHNTTNQTNTATGRCLSCHTYITIFWAPLQHTSHVCWNIAWLYTYMQSGGPICRQELCHVKYDTTQSMPRCSVCTRSTASSLEHQL